MSSNLLNQILRNNISMKPNVLSRTRHAVVNNLTKNCQQEESIHTSGNNAHKFEDTTNSEDVSEGPVRQCKSLLEIRLPIDKINWDSTTRVQKPGAKSVKHNNNLIDNNFRAQNKPLNLLKRPSNTVEKEIMPHFENLKKQSESEIKAMKRTCLRKCESDTSIISGNSKYSRPVSKNPKLPMGPYIGTSINKYSISRSLSTRDAPRNQQMNPNFTANTIEIAKYQSNRQLMCVDNRVKNLISVTSNQQSLKEKDPLYSWKHPPSPDEYEFNITRIIENPPNQAEVQYGRSKLLKKHSPWENHMKAIKSLDEKEPHLKYSLPTYASVPKSYLPTDDPNCIIDKPVKRDLTVCPSEKKQKQEANFTTVEATRKAKRSVASEQQMGHNANPLTKKMNPDIARILNMHNHTRYVHAYSSRSPTE